MARASLAPRDWLPASLATLASGILVAPLLVSLGFHAEDEGFVLAGAKRLLSGQLPHRDFISTRPALSQILHAPELILFGERVILASRAVALAQFAVIAVAAVIAGQHALSPERRWGRFEQVGLGTLTFFACLNVFPLMAWHSVDAVMLAALGGLIVISKRHDPNRQWPGFLLLGLSYLARQNFLFVVPAALFLWGGWRKPVNWIVAAVPGAAYLAAAIALGFFEPMLTQLLTRTEFFSAAVRPVISLYGIAGLVIGFAAARLTLTAPPTSTASTVLRVLALVLAPMIALVAINAPFHQEIGWLLPGVLLGLMLGASRDTRLRPWLRFSAMAWVIAWCASISLGWNYPTLFAGGLLVAIAAFFQESVPEPQLGATSQLVPALAVGVACLVVAARLIVPEGEAPVRRMTFDMGRVDPALAGIRTNQVLGKQLLDATGRCRSCEGPYVLLPGYPTQWVVSGEKNPLITDYPSDAEMASPALQRRVAESLDDLRGETTFVVFKRPPELSFHADKGEPAPKLPVGSAVRHIRTTYDKVDETEWVEVYR